MTEPFSSLVSMTGESLPISHHLNIFAFGRF
jgi:hypothetical protein